MQRFIEHKKRGVSHKKISHSIELFDSYHHDSNILKLSSYIKQKMLAGVNEQVLLKELHHAGWTNSQINESLRMVHNVSAVSQVSVGEKHKRKTKNSIADSHKHHFTPANFPLAHQSDEQLVPQIHSIQKALDERLEKTKKLIEKLHTRREHEFDAEMESKFAGHHFYSKKLDEVHAQHYADDQQTATDSATKNNSKSDVPVDFAKQLQDSTQNLKDSSLAFKQAASEMKKNLHNEVTGANSVITQTDAKNLAQSSAKVVDEHEDDLIVDELKKVNNSLNNLKEHTSVESTAHVFGRSLEAVNNAEKAENKDVVASDRIASPNSTDTLTTSTDTQTTPTDTLTTSSQLEKSAIVGKNVVSSETSSSESVVEKVGANRITNNSDNVQKDDVSKVEITQSKKNSGASQSVSAGSESSGPSVNIQTSGSQTNGMHTNGAGANSLGLSAQQQMSHNQQTPTVTAITPERITIQANVVGQDSGAQLPFEVDDYIPPSEEEIKTVAEQTSKYKNPAIKQQEQVVTPINASNSKGGIGQKGVKFGQPPKGASPSRQLGNGGAGVGAGGVGGTTVGGVTDLEQRFRDLSLSEVSSEQAGFEQFFNPLEMEEIHLTDNPIGDRAQTGIGELDSVIDGGVPRNSTVVLAGGAGTGKTSFALQFLVNGIVLFGEPGIYITFEQTRDSIFAMGKQFGWDLENLEKQNMLIIREYSPEQVSKAFKSGGGSIRDFVDAIHAKRIVVDSITEYMMLHSSEMAQRRELIEMFKYFVKWGCTSLIIAQEESDLRFHKSSVLDYEADGVILLYNERRGDVRMRGIEIFKMRGTHHTGRIFPMHITDHGVTVKVKNTKLLKSTSSSSTPISA